MTNLIVEVSKYLMILLMAIYTYANFRFFSFPDLERKRKVCARQNRAMFLLHFLAYVVMYLKTEDETLRRMLLVFYMGQVVFFLFYIYIYRFIYRNVSRLLVNNCCMLLACGFIMLTRLSLDKGLDKAFKQFVIVKFKGIDDINDIEKYKGKSLFVARENAVELEEDEYYIGDLIGMDVYTDESEERFGVLKDVMETGANEVYIVQSERYGEVLLPAIHECILEVDPEEKKMTVHLMEGLI